MEVITKDALKQFIESKADIALIDVREPYEFAEGNIQTSVNIPLTKVPQYLESVPKEKKLVFYCRTGERSGRAAQFAESRGYI